MTDLPSLKEIHTVVRARLEVARAAKDEHERLTAALAALEGATPYGRKADGSPRKRPGRRARSNGLDGGSAAD